MDPVSAWLLVLATMWVLRAAAEDGYATVRGLPESPRIARRRARQQLAQQHIAMTGQPTIGQAVASRVAQRIANPRREIGPARRYLAGLWEDSWEDAATRHEERRRKREERRREQEQREREQAEREAAGRPDPDNALRTRLCLGRCGVLVVEPREWCDDCEARDADHPEEYDDDEPDGLDDIQIEDLNRATSTREYNFWYCANGCGRAVPNRADWCPACLIDLVPPTDVRPDDGPDPDDDTPGDDQPAPETPEPDPAPDTTRKDTPPVTNPTEIDGDVRDPLTSLAYATGCLDTNTRLMNELDAMANNLAGEGVGGEVVQIVRDAWNAAEQFGLAALGARDEFARHVAVQAGIAGNTELRDTVRDTYLDTARA